MKRLLAGLGTLLTIVAALSPGVAWALTDEEIFRDFRFNFINPGARSLGLGGAFIAAADDATAAEANPAALHYVDQMEFFIEVRGIRPETQIIRPSQGTIGRVDTTIPFNTPPFFDTSQMPPVLNPGNPDPFFLEMQSVTNRADQTLPSFVSFVFPFTLGARRATFAVSRQVVLDVESTLTDPEKNEETALRFANNDTKTWVNDGSLGCADNPQEVGTDQFYSVCNLATGSLDAELVNYNLSFSYSFHRDFSLGLTATYAALDMQSFVENVTQDPRGLFFSQNPRDLGGVLADVTTQTFTNGTDSDLTYTIGLHWHPDTAFPHHPVSPIKFGLVYRKGARLAVEERVVEVDPASGALTDLRTPFDNVLSVPDRLGLGFSYDLANHWTFAVDVENIEYSDLLDNFQTQVNFFTSQQLFDSFPETAVQNLKFDVDDALVFHAGVEYFSFFRSGWGYALRAGYYTAPDNRIRLTEVEAVDQSLTPEARARVEEIYKDVFRGAEDVDHVTAGFSFNTPIGLQLQVAGDFSDVGDQFLVSAKYRFGKYR
jgi:long-subunit fatty acid transport protein